MIGDAQLAEVQLIGATWSPMARGRLRAASVLAAQAGRNVTGPSDLLRACLEPTNPVWMEWINRFMSYVKDEDARKLEIDAEHLPTPSTQAGVGVTDELADIVGLAGHVARQNGSPIKLEPLLACAVGWLAGQSLALEPANRERLAVVSRDLAEAFGVTRALQAQAPSSPTELRELGKACLAELSLGRLDGETPCTGCGYALQGQLYTQGCPECGQPVVRTLGAVVQMDHATSAVLWELACRRCGHSLKGMSPASRCPKCDTPLTESIMTQSRDPGFGWTSALIATLVVGFAVVLALYWR